MPSGPTQSPATYKPSTPGTSGRGRPFKPPCVAVTRAFETVIAGKKRLATTALRYRSEEHTSELQSLRQLVCRPLLEKKKTQRATDDTPELRSTRVNIH